MKKGRFRASRWWLLGAVGAVLGCASSGGRGEIPVAMARPGLFSEQQLGHDAPIVALALSDNGRLLASGDEAGMVVVWDVASGRSVRGIESSFDGDMRWLAFEPGGRTLLGFYGSEGMMRAEVSAGRWSRALDPSLLSEGFYPMLVALSADGRLGAVVDELGRIQIWDLALPRRLSTLPWEDEGEIYAVAMSADGARVAVSNEHHINLHSTTSGALLWSFTLAEEATAVALAFSPTGDRLLVGHDMDRAEVWDLTAHKQQSVYPIHGATVARVAFGQRGDIAVAVDSEGGIHLWEASTGKPRWRMSVEDSEFPPVVLMSDARHLVTPKDANTLQIWDIEALQRQRFLSRHNGREVWSFALSPDGRLLASSGEDGQVMVWDLVEDAPRLAFDKHNAPVHIVQFNPAGTRLASAGESGEVLVWDLDGNVQRSLPGFTSMVWGLAWSPDGRLVAAGGEHGVVRIWEVDSGFEVAQYSAHSSAIYGLTFSPDGQRVLSGSSDGLMVMTGIDGVEQARVDANVSQELWAVAFSADGTRALLGGSSGEVELWDLRRQRRLRVIEGHDEGVNYVAFSPDGQRALTASDDGTARIWELSTGRELNRLGELFDDVYAATFDPTGTRAFAGSDEGEVITWDPGAEVMVRTIGDPGRGQDDEDDEDD